MSERSYDRPRESSSTSVDFGARWFFVSSTWTDVSETNQSCRALVAKWSPATKEWSPGTITETIWDPTKVAQPGMGQLIRAIWNPVSRHWEIDTTQELVFFRIVEDKLLATQPVVCEILTFDGAAWVPSAVFFELYDDYYNAPGFFTGKSLIDRGWARLRKRADDPELELDQYELVWMSGPCHVVEFTLTANRTAAVPAPAEAVAATIDQYYLYGHDQLAPTSIWFSATKFPFAKTGAKGTALYDDRNRRYVAVQCDQLCITAHATLAENMCTDESFYVTDFENCTDWPFSQQPVEDEQGRVAVLNWYNHRGKSGDDVQLVFWQELESYVIIDVTKHAFTVGGSLSDDGTNLTQQVLNTVLETCSAESTNLIGSETCGSGG